MAEARRERSPWGRVVAVTAVAVTSALWVLGLVLAGMNGSIAGAVPGIGAVGFAVTGALVLFQRPENRLGWLFCGGAVAMTVLGAGGAYADRALVRAPGSLPGGEFVAWLADFMAIPTIGLFAGVLPQLFPTGRPVSPRWRLPVWAAWGYIVLGAVGNGFTPQQLESVPGFPNPYAIAPAKAFFAACIGLSVPAGALALLGGIASLVTRWRRSEGDERQQLKWFITGVVLLPVPLALHDTLPGASDALFSALFVIIPATLAVSILRYRLYDLNLAVRRAVGYVIVSAAVAGVYLAFVGAAELAVSGRVSLTVHVLAAVAAAAGFHPLRARVQRGVDRVFYGDRSRPYDALARLGRRLESTLAPDTVLPGVVETVAEALRLPYVAIELLDAGTWALAAECGSKQGEPGTFPMTYQAETVGRMLVCPRAREKLTPADRQLLADLARQAGVAAHAVRTTTALQRSRAELVAAREEERRRLRRDLHDGLGPTLAGVTMGLHAASTRVRQDPGEAERLLGGLESQVEEAVADIRRLVYGLRPPALDEFGLVRAVHMHAARMEGTEEGPTVSIESSPQGLGPLPAAVEVAAYRIVTEALTNVARHARARTCVVRISLNGALEVEVADDGTGFPAGCRAGVGITAMRERAAELGGTLTVESMPTGTRVRARLPALEGP
jgi:signal transduction histidine kinase